MKKISLLFAFILMLTACSGSDPSRTEDSEKKNPEIEGLAGTERGNGADYFSRYRYTAWFFNPEREIQVCYSVSEGFGVEESRLVDAIEDGLDIWLSYIKRKRVQKIYSSRPDQGLATQYVVKGRCRGDEDLSFYFGVENSEIGQAIARHENPYATSQRQQYDVEAGWGKGFIWLKKPNSLDTDWSVAGSLEAVLLHEIGHVFGCPHIDETIMREDIGQEVQRLAERDPNRLLKKSKHLDHENELYRDRIRGAPYNGFLGISLEEEGAIFRQLVGRDKVGKVSSSVQQLGFNKYQLKIVDELGEVGLELSVVPESTSIFLTSYVFQAQVGEKGLALENFSIASLAATVSLPSGEELLVQISHNMNPLVLKTRSDEQGEPIFWSNKLAISTVSDGKIRFLFNTTF